MTIPLDLQIILSKELERLSATAKDVEAHLEDALGSDDLQQTTITGIQQIDELAQVLEHLSQLLFRASQVSPMSNEIASQLLDCVQLTSLQHRLAGKDLDSSSTDFNHRAVELF